MWIIEIILYLTFFNSKGKGPSLSVVAVLTTLVLIGAFISIAMQSSVG